jgi:cyclohexanecarboxylate-CoA ligase
MRVTLAAPGSRVRAVPPPARVLRATWVPSQARRYRRPGGPWRGLTLDALIARNGGEVVDGDRRFSHDQVETLVARVAGGLAQQGARRGRAVAWQLPNGVTTSILYRACWRLGAVAVPLLHTLGERERADALAQVSPAVTVDLDPAAASDPAALLSGLDGAPVPPGALPVQASDLAVALFTSGSSGTPKAVLHSHRGLSWKATLMVRVHGLSATDAVLMPAPQAHVSGLLNGVLLPGAAGLRTVLVRRFDPDEALALVERERISFMAGPPTFFVAMATSQRARARDVSSVRLISSGGAAVTPAFVESTAEAFACRVKRTYGSTEAPTVTTSTDDDPFDRSRDTDGRAVGEVELRISDPLSGARLGRGAAGELWVRGPELFAGYADDEQTREAIEPGGWFRTGDLGTLDHDGWLSIVGRLKDVIIRGGENISASDVEGVLEAHPLVRQAVAVSYPDDLMGERVAAFVVADGPFDLEVCRAWFAQRGVAKFKTPERVFQLGRLPLLGTGKPDRATLGQLAAGH